MPPHQLGECGFIFGFGKAAEQCVIVVHSLTFCGSSGKLAFFLKKITRVRKWNGWLATPGDGHYLRPKEWRIQIRQAHGEPMERESLPIVPAWVADSEIGAPWEDVPRHGSG